MLQDISNAYHGRVERYCRIKTKSNVSVLGSKLLIALEVTVESYVYDEDDEGRLVRLVFARHYCGSQ